MPRIRKLLMLLVLGGLLSHAGLVAHHDAAMHLLRVQAASLTADLDAICESSAGAKSGHASHKAPPAPADDDDWCVVCLVKAAHGFLASAKTIVAPVAAAPSRFNVWAEFVAHARRSLRPPPRGPPLFV